MKERYHPAECARLQRDQLPWRQALRDRYLGAYTSGTLDSVCLDVMDGPRRKIEPPPTPKASADAMEEDAAEGADQAPTKLPQTGPVLLVDIAHLYEALPRSSKVLAIRSVP